MKSKIALIDFGGNAFLPDNDPGQQEGQSKNAQKPTKYEGPFYTKERALEFQNEKKWTMIEDAGQIVIPSN